MVARLLRTLRETGELRDTYFIFTSDNGYLLGEHGLTGKGVAYEESVRVPLMIRGPGIEAGGVSNSLVANIDLAPTITSLASAEPGRELDGRSLRDVLLDGGELDRKEMLLELLEGRDAFRSVRTDRWMYATYVSGGSELYDLDRDPFELRNLAGKPQFDDAEERLGDKLESLSHCAGQSCP